MFAGDDNDDDDDDDDVNIVDVAIVGVARLSERRHKSRAGGQSATNALSPWPAVRRGAAARRLAARTASR